MALTTPEQLDQLLVSIDADETLSDQTKKELRDRIKKSREIKPVVEGIKDVQDIQKDFAAAIEGSAPKFKARQTQKAFGSILADRPGRKQTILTR